MIKINNEDCLLGLAKIKDCSVDAIITDPPYFVLEKQSWDMQWKSKAEYFEWFDKVFAEMLRVLKDGGQMYIFFSQKFMADYMSKYKPARMLIWWHRNLAQPTNKMWLYEYDPIFYHVKGNKPKTFNGKFTKGYNVDVLMYSKPQRWKGHIRYHPAEKNLEMIKRLVEVSTNEGDVVLDPFVGGGTTPVACRDLKRNFVGFEKEKKYYKISKDRLATKKTIKEI